MNMLFFCVCECGVKVADLYPQRLGSNLSSLRRIRWKKEDGHAAGLRDRFL